MESVDFSDRLDSLEQKVILLLKKYVALKQELQKVSLEKQELSKKVEKQKEQIKNFQNQIELSKIVAKLAEAPDARLALKAQIEAYMKEIDTCILQLSN